jgi:hypothetical protein
MKIDSTAAEKEKDRQRDILVAEIRAAGYGSMVDVNKNEESDYVDAMKEIRESEQYQEQTGLQREKEVNRMNNEAQKNQIEREKIAAQKEIANKQLQIAQENKNKFDVKSRNNEGKK